MEASASDGTFNPGTTGDTTGGWAVGRRGEAPCARRQAGGRRCRFGSRLGAPRHSLAPAPRAAASRRLQPLSTTSCSPPTPADGAGRPGRSLTTAPAPWGPFGVVSAMGDTQGARDAETDGREKEEQIKRQCRGDERPTRFPSPPEPQAPGATGPPGPVQHTAPRSPPPRHPGATCPTRSRPTLSF